MPFVYLTSWFICRYCRREALTHCEHRLFNQKNTVSKIIGKVCKDPTKTMNIHLLNTGEAFSIYLKDAELCIQKSYPACFPL